MSKSIKEWAELLPIDIRKRFIANFSGNEAGLLRDCFSLDKCIESSFTWGSTPEGSKYWSNVHTKAVNGYYPIESIEDRIKNMTL